MITYSWYDFSSGTLCPVGDRARRWSDPAAPPNGNQGAESLCKNTHRDNMDLLQKNTQVDDQKYFQKKDGKGGK